MNIDRNEFISILNNLADLVEFAERQDKDGKIDGTNDPFAYLIQATRTLDKYAKDWRNTPFVIPA